MKPVFYTLIMLLCTVSGAMAEADRELSSKATLAVRRGITQTLGEDQATGMSAVRIIVELENAMPMEDRFIIGARFSVVLDNRLIHMMTASVVGIGDDRTAARENLVLDWLGEYGAPLVYYLTNQPGIVIDDLRVYTGPIGIRGDAPLSWLTTGELHEHVIDALGGELQGPLTTIDLKINFTGDGAIVGECRINGELSPQALNRLLAIDWPSDAGFMLKQFYIVVNSEAAVETD